jgi:hypothetical protein
MTRTNHRRLSAWLLAVWFLFALSASALQVFRSAPEAPPIALGLSVVIPIAVFVLWFAMSPGFREFALSLNSRTLTLAQTGRTIGVVFVILYAYGILPGVFALPAGWGDVAIGVTAPLVALKLTNRAHRRSFVLWQLLGMLDLIAAVTLGTTARLIDPSAIPTAPVTVFPLSLIPTFGVPFWFVLHIISIAQARQWREQTYSSVGRRIATPAA